MSETVPLDFTSRWSGLSPWVLLLLRPMAGAASRGGGRVRGKPPGSSPGHAPSCNGDGSCPRPESGRRPGRRVWCWGVDGWRPAGEAGWKPECGLLPRGTARPFKHGWGGGGPGAKRGAEPPRLPHGPGHGGGRALSDPTPSRETNAVGLHRVAKREAAFNAGLSTLAATITDLRPAAAGPGGCDP